MAHPVGISGSWLARITRHARSLCVGGYGGAICLGGWQHLSRRCERGLERKARSPKLSTKRSAVDRNRPN